jgi:hypothetical protein
VDWSYDGPPEKRCWPISEGEAEERRKIVKKIYSNRKDKDRLE